MKKISLLLALTLSFSMNAQLFYYGTDVSGLGASAFGFTTTASGNRSTAMGYDTTASDYGSLVIGKHNPKALQLQIVLHHLAHQTQLL